MHIKTAILASTLAYLPAAAVADWKALSALEHAGARVSASAIDLDNGSVLGSLKSDMRLTPASVTKLITAAATLEAWPSDRMFHTSLMTAGNVRNGLLNGDLILRSAGDPSLDDHSLWALAAQLRSQDITAVTGGLTVSLAPFGSVGCGTKDRCEAARLSDRAYNAPIAAMGVDFGNWCVLVRPTQLGSDAQVGGCGVAHLPIRISGSVKTVAAGARQTLWVERETTAEGDALHIGGDVPIGIDQHIWRAMSDSSRGVGLLLIETLHELGITVSGPVTVSEQPPPADARELAATEGLTLREQLGRMLRFSNNYIADVLTMDLAASVASVPPSDLSSASQVLLRFMSRVTHGASSTDQPSMALFSGSGLTVENRLSANDLNALLAYQYRSTAHFPAFYGALTVPRDAPFEFMRRGGDNWLDRVALKTGTLNDPVSVCAVAGYLRKRDGGWIAFTAIINGGPNRSHIPLDDAMRAIQSDMEDILVRQ
jgi:D-alanyl-D-alanine carboxypeptidase/D-alanyl-D-alanine-endopeptidase (penicillin-binding protein 4)